MYRALRVGLKKIEFHFWIQWSIKPVVLNYFRLIWKFYAVYLALYNGPLKECLLLLSLSFVSQSPALRFTIEIFPRYTFEGSSWFHSQCPILKLIRQFSQGPIFGIWSWFYSQGPKLISQFPQGPLLKSISISESCFRIDKAISQGPPLKYISLSESCF